MVTERFYCLFESNEKHCGRIVNGKIITERVRYDISDIERHLSGVSAIGLSPIKSDSSCRWGALDIDTHKKGVAIDFDELESKNNKLDTPLVICQSRNLGAHLFLFLETDTPAAEVVKHLEYLAKQLGYKDKKQCEIFPKQTFLADGDLSNWLNMPYFGDTRKMFFEGETRDIDVFLSVAEKRTYTITAPLKSHKIVSDEILNQSPPCIVDMLKNGVDSGGRNEAMYNFTVFAKKVDATNYTNMAMDFNSNCLTPPLPYSEAKSAIKSAGRREYQYKCSAEPCRSRCNSAVCIVRKYGINASDVGKNPDGSDIFTKLTKILTDPVTWELTVDGLIVRVPTEILMDFRRLRLNIIETLTKIIPPLKGDTWDEILKPLMANANVIYAPEDAAPGGLLFERLKEFLNTASVDVDKKSIANVFSRGVPIVTEIDGSRVCAFKGSAFIEYMRRRKYDELKGAALWLALRELGVEHSTIELVDDIIDVWYIKYTPVTKKRILIETQEEF